MVEIDYKDAVEGEYYMMVGLQPKTIFFIKYVKCWGGEFSYNLPLVCHMERGKVMVSFRENSIVWSVETLNNHLVRVTESEKPLILFKLTDDEITTNILMELVTEHI